jgi:hypothetical protein
MLLGVGGIGGAFTGMVLSIGWIGAAAVLCVVAATFGCVVALFWAIDTLTDNAP